MNPLLLLAVSDKRVHPSFIDAIQPAWTSMTSESKVACGIGEIGPGGEPLVTRRPLNVGADFPSFHHLPNGGFATMQTCPITAGSAFSNADVPVYKYHRWMWTMCSNLKLLEEAAGHILPVPDHIFAQQRDEGPNQEIFLQCLAFMQSYRLLRKLAPTLDSIKRSFDAALSLVDTRYEGKQGEDPQFVATLVEQRIMIIQTLNTPMWLKFLGEDKEDPIDENLRTPMGLQPPRGVAISNLSSEEDDWEALPPSCTIIIDRYGRFRWEASPMNG
jgi:hypothetical protein